MTDNPNNIPTEISLSRDNVNAILQAYFTAKYRLKPGDRTFTFNWKGFPEEVRINLTR